MPSLTNDFINGNLSNLAGQGFQLYSYDREESTPAQEAPLGGIKAFFQSSDRSRASVLAFYQLNSHRSDELDSALEQLARRLNNLSQFKEITCLMVFVSEKGMTTREDIELLHQTFHRRGKAKIGFVIIDLPLKTAQCSKVSSNFTVPSFVFKEEAFIPAFIQPVQNLKVQSRQRIYTQTPWSVYALILLNIILFAYSFSPEPTKRLFIGSLYGYSVWQGEYWRLLTAVGLHGGMGHLIGNAIGLYLFGIKIEEFVGWIRFITIYIVAGLWSSILCLLLNPLVPTVGASGAIFGLAGALFYLILRNRKFFWGNILFFALFAIIDLSMGALDPTISTVGHIGGFIGGLFTAAVLGILGDSMNPNFIIRSITLSVVTLFALIVVVSPPTKGVNQLCWQAHLQANAGEYQSAIAILNQAQKAYPHQKKEIQLKIFQVETEWADRLYGLKNYREAIRHYTVIIKHYDPQSPKIYQNMATACQSLGETEEASFWYKKAKEAVSANSVLGILQ